MVRVKLEDMAGKRVSWESAAGLDKDAKNAFSPMSVLRFLLLEQMLIQERCATARLQWIAVIGGCYLTNGTVPRA